MSRVRSFARTYWFEIPIALLAILAMVELVVWRDSPGAPATSLWFALPAVAVLVLPLLARRRFPFAGPVTYWVLATALTFADGLLIPFMRSLFPVGMASALLLGNVRNPLKAVAGLAVVVSGAFIVVYNVPGAQLVSELIVIPVEFGVSWLAGYALRARAEQAEAAEVRAAQAEREREAAARIAVAEERARIARELHDIVAHAVSVMVLQIGALRHKLSNALDEDKDALQGVERTGRAALAEMRRLLGAMHDGGETEFAPQPGLDRLDALAENIRGAGLPVRVHVEGEAFPLPRAIDLSAYRIVQEGLTNALKHARASQADVTVRYGDEGLQLEVRDDGIGAMASDGLGHGLVGIRERVKIYGGEMSAGSANGSGFVLTARLPLDSYQA